MLKQASRVLWLVSAVTVVLLMVPTSAFAQDQVAGTRHDLTPAGGGTIKLTAGTDQVCVFCHTPHMANTTLGVALWNRATGAGYTMYPTGGTIDMTIGAQPGPISLACLSCHDGVIAFDQLYNGPTLASGAYDYDPTAAARGYTWAGGNNVMPAGATNVGTDLSNDHPVGVTYDPTLDTAFNAAASVTGAGLRLYGGANDQVECGSCHNPHDATTQVPFLRISNAASALCTTCHIK